MGDFGGRLSRRLLGGGYQVLVGGRSLRKATAFCAGLAHCRPIRVDRHGDVATILTTERPDIVVDAAGPFQQSDYRVIEACIEARIAYIDLADAPDFVTGVGRFDDAAKAANIPIISGASSVPALSHAVVAELATKLDQITAIEIAISASSRASAGPSVSKAILGGVGQEMRRGPASAGKRALAGSRFAPNRLRHLRAIRLAAAWLRSRTSPIWLCFLGDTPAFPR